MELYSLCKFSQTCAVSAERHGTPRSARLRGERGGTRASPIGCRDAPGGRVPSFARILPSAGRTLGHLERPGVQGGVGRTCPGAFQPCRGRFRVVPSGGVFPRVSPDGSSARSAPAKSRRPRLPGRSASSRLRFVSSRRRRGGRHRCGDAPHPVSLRRFFVPAEDPARGDELAVAVPFLQQHAPLRQRRKPLPPADRFHLLLLVGPTAARLPRRPHHGAGGRAVAPLAGFLPEPGRGLLQVHHPVRVRGQPVAPQGGPLPGAAAGQPQAPSAVVPGAASSAPRRRGRSIVVEFFFDPPQFAETQHGSQLAGEVQGAPRVLHLRRQVFGQVFNGHPRVLEDVAEYRLPVEPRAEKKGGQEQHREADHAEHPQKSAGGETTFPARLGGASPKNRTRWRSPGTALYPSKARRTPSPRSCRG